jgi:phosphate transport system permease protein
LKSQKYEDFYLVYRKIKNILAISIVSFISLAAAVPLILVFSYIVMKGFPGLNLSFFTELPKPLGEPGGGARHALTGSLVIVGLACLIGIPWGVGAGIFLSESNSLTSRTVRFATDILGSVPSILIGLYAYAMIVRPMKAFSALSAAFALAVIMIPLVARSSEEILRQTPRHIYEAGFALGVQRWRVILQVVVRGSWPGILTAILVATARIAGETAPLLYTAFGNSFGYRGLLQPIASLPVQIFEYAISPFESWQQMAWTSSLVLLLFIFLVNLCVRTLFRAHSSEKRS